MLVVDINFNIYSIWKMLRGTMEPDSHYWRQWLTNSWMDRETEFTRITEPSTSPHQARKS